jgi:nitrogen regulatory protein P-II 1
VKKIEAVIRPERLPMVRKELECIGVTGITIKQVLGHGAQRGITYQWRGATHKIDLLPKVELYVVVSDELAERVIHAIEVCARTREVGDGKIFVSNAEDAVRVRTGDRGEAAL